MGKSTLIKLIDNYISSVERKSSKEIEQYFFLIKKLETEYKKNNINIKNILEDISIPSDWLLNNIKNYLKELIYHFRVEGDDLVLTIKSFCDFKCVFCDRSFDEYKKLNQKTTIDKIKTILRYTDLSNVSQITIGGDEPFSCKDIYIILDLLDSLDKKIYIKTSGSRFGEIEKIFGYKNIKGFEIPIYGSNPQTFDAVTGVSGSYEICKKGLTILKNKGYELGLHTVLVRQNQYDEKLFEEIGSVGLLMPNTFWTKEIYSKTALNFKEISDFFSKFPYEKKLYYFTKYNYPLPVCLLNDGKFDISNFVKNVEMPKKQNPNKDINETQTKDFLDAREYVKPEKCKNCKLFDKCNGYFGVHFEVFGENEVNPVF